MIFKMQTNSTERNLAYFSPGPEEGLHPSIFINQCDTVKPEVKTDFGQLAVYFSARTEYMWARHPCWCLTLRKIPNYDFSKKKRKGIRWASAPRFVLMWKSWLPCYFLNFTHHYILFHMRYFINPGSCVKYFVISVTFIIEMMKSNQYLSLTCDPQISRNDFEWLSLHEWFINWVVSFFFP